MKEEDIEHLSKKIALNLFSFMSLQIDCELQKVENIKIQEYSTIALSSVVLASVGAINLISSIWTENGLEINIEEIYGLYKKIMDSKFEDYLKFKGKIMNIEEKGTLN